MGISDLNSRLHYLSAGYIAYGSSAANGIVINGDANERTLSKLADMLSARLRSGLHDGAYA